MKDTVFEELGLWMEAVTQTLVVFSGKRNKITSTLILQSFGVHSHSTTGLLKCCTMRAQK